MTCSGSTVPGHGPAGRPSFGSPGWNPVAVRGDDMAERVTSGGPAPTVTEADLDAFLRHRDDALARAEDRAASLALEAISGRIIHLAAGIVMHQNGLAPDAAEDLLRRSARMAAITLPQLAASVVRSGALAGSAVPHGPGARRETTSMSQGMRRTLTC